MHKEEEGNMRKEAKLIRRIDAYLENPSGTFLRNHNGITDYVDRIKALGNMVVPQQFYPIFRAIADMEQLNI